MALNKRSLGVKRTHAKGTVSMHVSKGLDPGGKHAHVYSMQQSDTRSAQRAANAERAAAAAAVVRTLQLLTKKMKM